MSKWHKVCQISDIFEGTGVCALVEGQQVAIFRPTAEESVFAIHNMDPFAESNVLSRGIIGYHEALFYVASPLKKQRFILSTGVCLEDQGKSVAAYKSRVTNGSVEIYV